MLSNALLAFSLFSVVALGTSLVLMFGIELNGGEEGKESIKLKSYLILAQIVISLFVVFGKFMAILFWKDVQTDDVLMKSLGFCFYEDKSIDVF